MTQEDRQDRISDPALAAAMADLRAELPHEVDWDRLRRSINDGAEMALARRRVSKRFFFPKSLIPLAAAASVAFALWMGPRLVSQLLPGAYHVSEIAAEMASDEVLIETLGSDLSEQEFADLVTGRSNPDVLLAVAIGDN